MRERHGDKTLIRFGDVELIVGPDDDYFTIGRRDGVCAKLLRADATNAIMCLVDAFSACTHTGT